MPLVRLSVILSICILVCRLLPSFFYCPTFLSCLLLSCLIVCLPAGLPVCLSIGPLIRMLWPAYFISACHLACLTFCRRRLFACQSSCTSVYWTVCLSASLSSAPIFLWPSTLPVLSIAVLPNSMSVCLPACLSVFLSCRWFACFCSAYLYFCLPSCLLTCCDDACLSAVYWSTCLSASLSSAPIFLLQSLHPVLYVAVLPNSMSAGRLAWLV